MTLRETILQADDIEEAVIEVPEWDDVKITLRSLTGKERVQLYEGVTGKQKVFMYADILIATARDPETTDPVFDPADREALAEKSGIVLDRLAAEVLGLSGLDSDEAEAEVETDPTSGGG